MFFFKSVRHSHNLLHNHPINQPRTNSHFKAHMCPILPVQSPSSNPSSSSRKFLRRRLLSREFHVTRPTRDMSTPFGSFSYVQIRAKTRPHSLISKAVINET